MNILNTQNTIQNIFKLGMKRDIPELLPLAEGGLAFDCGASGKAVAPGAQPLGLPDWQFPLDQIPAEDGTVDTIHAYHFMEHLTGEDAIMFLAEVQRCLKPGGVLQFCIPYYNSSLASQDLTHKSFWTEESFRTLFRNHYYDPTAGKIEWELDVHAIFIMAIVERNTALLGQIVKKG